jgi:hypothetical protein
MNKKSGPQNETRISQPDNFRPIPNRPVRSSDHLRYHKGLTVLPGTIGKGLFLAQRATKFIFPEGIGCGNNLGGRLHLTGIKFIQLVDIGKDLVKLTGHRFRFCKGK